MFKLNDFIIFISSYDAKMKISKYFHFAFSSAYLANFHCTKVRKKNNKHHKKTKRDLIKHYFHLL